MYFIKLDSNSTLDPISGFITDEEMTDPTNACEAINRVIQKETEHLGIKAEFKSLITHGDTHIGQMVIHTKDMIYTNEEWILINALPVMTIEDITQEAFDRRQQQGARYA